MDSSLIWGAKKLFGVVLYGISVQILTKRAVQKAGSATVYSKTPDAAVRL